MVVAVSSFFIRKYVFAQRRPGETRKTKVSRGKQGRREKTILILKTYLCGLCLSHSSVGRYWDGFVCTP